MPPFMSQEGYVGIGRQTVSGSYVTPQKYLLVDSIDMNPDTDLLIPDAEIGMGRDIADDVYVGPVKWSGSLAFNFRPEAVGFLLLGATGAVTSSGISGNAYGHTFTLENDLVPLSIEKKVGDGLEIFGYNDVKVNTLRIECAAGELVKGTAEVVAVKETSGKTDQVETFETAPIFTFAGGKVTLEGSDISVKNISFEINNNIIDDDFRIGSRTLASLVEKRRELSASMDVVPTDANIYKKAVYGASGATTVSGLQQTYSGALHLSFESADGVYISGTQKYTMDIDIPKAIFRKADLPTSGDEMIIETLEMLPVKGTGAIATITLRNSVANYNAA